MHELAITESLLEIAQRHARAAGAQRVTALYLVLGQLSTVVDESVQFYWDFVSRGTMAEGARLHVRHVPAQLRCRACGMAYRLRGRELACPDCGSPDVAVTAGDEFHLEAIDVDGEDGDNGSGGDSGGSAGDDGGNGNGNSGDNAGGDATGAGGAAPADGDGNGRQA